MSDLVGVRGDTEIYKLTVTDALGAEVNLDGSTLWFTVKVDQDDPDDLAVINKTTISGQGIEIATQSGSTLGVAEITLDPEDTSRMLAPFTYHYDVQWQTPVGAVTTVENGTFSLTADVTRTTI